MKYIHVHGRVVPIREANEVHPSVKALGRAGMALTGAGVVTTGAGAIARVVGEAKMHQGFGVAVKAFKNGGMASQAFQNARVIARSGAKQAMAASKVGRIGGIITNVGLGVYAAGFAKHTYDKSIKKK